MALKTQRVFYSARNLQVGLSDVKANIYKDGNSAPVATALALSELDAVNAQGVYLLALTPAQLVGWGGKGVYLAKIDSVSKPAPATAKIVVLENDEDDLEAHLVSIETKIDSVISSLAAQDVELASIKSTVQSSNAVLTDVNVGNANLKNILDNIVSAVTSVQNNTSFVGVLPAEMIIPNNGTQLYQIPMRIRDAEGNMEDPDNNEVFVTIKNEAGLDRTALLVGYVGGPVQATRTALGKYHVEVEISNTAAVEQLIFEFTYTENGQVQSHVRTANTVPDTQASGFALQTTLLEVLTDTMDIQPRVLTIQAILEDANYGNSAIKALLSVVNGIVGSNNALLADNVFGLEALQAIAASRSSQVSVDAIDLKITNDILGTGFNNTTDSLKQISDRTFFGGVAE